MHFLSLKDGIQCHKSSGSKEKKISWNFFCPGLLLVRDDTQAICGHRIQTE